MRSSEASGSALFAILIAGCLAGAASAIAQESPDETIVSRSLRFRGRVVGLLPSGQAIRERAIYRGREYLWRGEIKERLASEDTEIDENEGTLDVAGLSLDELAEMLRGVALFNGHEFIEAKPALDIAANVKKQDELERNGASRRKLEKLFPAVVPSQGTAAPTTNLRAAERPPRPRRVLQPGAQVVHGLTDDRTVMNNLIYPHRTHIVFDNAGSTAVINGSQGSGTLIGPSTAMSVAHVFWNENANTWEADHRWAPGFDSQDTDSSPWGDWYRCYWVTIPNGYVALESHDFDYAVLDFDVGCSSVSNGVNSDRPGATVGWLGHYTASESSIEARTGYVRGYPGAAGTCGLSGQSCAVRVWGDLSYSSENDATSSAVYHQADTSGGQSGSGFYHYADPSCSGCGFGAYLVGMHRAGNSSYNIVRRYTSTVYNFVKAYSSDF